MKPSLTESQGAQVNGLLVILYIANSRHFHSIPKHYTNASHSIQIPHTAVMQGTAGPTRSNLFCYFGFLAKDPLNIG